MTDLAAELTDLFSTDTPTMILLAVFCGGAAWFMRDYLANPIMAIWAFPLFFGLALAAYRGFLASELFAPSRLDQWLGWVVTSATTGTIMGVIAIVAIMRLLERRAVR